MLEEPRTELAGLLLVVEFIFWLRDDAESAVDLPLEVSGICMSLLLLSRALRDLALLETETGIRLLELAGTDGDDGACGLLIWACIRLNSTKSFSTRMRRVKYFRLKLKKLNQINSKFMFLVLFLNILSLFFKARSNHGCFNASSNEVL